MKDSIVDKVSKQIIHNIITDRYRPSSRLPSTDEFASEFGVGRSSVRESLKQLQTLGVIVLRHGDGTYLAEFIESSGGLGLIDQVVQARCMIEVYSARQAAQNRNEELNQTLARYVERMRSSEDNEEFVRWDRQFHYALSRSSKNILIATYHSSLDLLFDEVQKIIVGLPESPARAIEDHERMLAAVVAQDPDRAVECAQEHIESIEAQIREARRSGKLKR